MSKQLVKIALCAEKTKLCQQMFPSSKSKQILQVRYMGLTSRKFMEDPTLSGWTISLVVSLRESYEVYTLLM